MKLNSAYRVQDAEASNWPGIVFKSAHDHAINKVKRGVSELLLKQLDVATNRINDNTATEYIVTVHVYSDERVHEVLREIETLITELRQRGLNGSADALRKIGYMLTSNKF